ncbi:MAG: signal peptide peptidase SppA [Bdellovibrionales bacterium]
MKRVVQVLFILTLAIFVGSIFLGIGGLLSVFSPPEEKVTKASLLGLDLEGVILDGKDILSDLRKYRKKEEIKGILIRINSPGGVVGPSQELNAEIRRTREVYKKPVIVFCSAVAASGAYYAAVAADKIITTPGCMIGSIGALMEFVNLEKLYDWAKIHRYSLTTGEFKDAGAEYKPLKPEERELFQELLQDVLTQFKAAILEGREMRPEHLDKYADGRVFTGARAVELGFADEIGTWDSARRQLGEMTGLGEDAEVFKPQKRHSFWGMLEEASAESKFKGLAEEVLQIGLSAKPLFLLPGAVRY